MYLVDYGLAYRYLADGKHREYQEDPRCAHDGTIEFTSRDAHKGVRKSEFNFTNHYKSVPPIAILDRITSRITE